jgi:hypothetical protein
MQARPSHAGRDMQATFLAKLVLQADGVRIIASAGVGDSACLK